MKAKDIYILGGQQTDFARNWQREGKQIYDLFAECVQGGLQATGLDPKEIQVGHVGNFVSASYTGQAHLGGFFGHVDPALAYMPASSHEAACASGSMAMLAAMADLESGRYDLACVVGVEMMRTGATGSDNLAAAAWVNREWQDADYVWPCAFDAMLDVYDQRYGIDKAHLTAISQKNFSNAAQNQNAQTRNWSFKESSFAEDDIDNPVVAGRIRKQDCGQVTDGAAVVFLATAEKARQYTASHGLKLEQIPRIKGWGHINAPMLFSEKLKLAKGQEYLFPHVRSLFEQTLCRAGLSDINEIDGLEAHDCFNITEYMILDHSGLCKPGEAWQAIESGATQIGGALPINASGGLIGLGHPVGATGVRMALDCYKQTTASAGNNQIDGARNMMTFNLGGTTTTCASLVIGV